MTNRLCFSGACLLWLTALVGCQGDSAHGPTDGLPVSGTVSINGKPVPYAMIEFAPIEAKELRQMVPVVAGKYAFRPSHGLGTGEYQVRLLPYEPEIEEIEAAKKSGLPDPVAARKALPVSVQKEGALKTTVEEGQIDAVDFDIQS